MTLLVLWGCSAAASLAIYVGAALAVDGRVVLMTWARIGLGVAAGLGPVGTVLVLALVGGVLGDARKRHCAWPRERAAGSKTTVLRLGGPEFSR